MSKRRICFITGSRADYGYIYWVMQELKRSKKVDLQLLVTGMHLDSQFGMTYKEIEKDGLKIDAKVKMLSSSDTSLDVAKSTAKGLTKIAEALEALKPELVVVVGDRYEMFAAASAAMFLQIPLAHIGGGEYTRGAMDESIRHAITKMGHIHFCSNKEAYNRVLQLGENPKHVFNFGSSGLDDIEYSEFFKRNELYKDLGLDVDKQTALVTYHSATNEKNNTVDTFRQVLKAIDSYNGNVVITGSNADRQGRQINRIAQDYTKKNRCARYYVNLGRRRYLSLLKYAQVMVGNSSSGLCEAPSFQLPVVNVGDRQAGRLCTKNVINVGYSTETIKKAIAKASQPKFKVSLNKVKNPYYQGRVASKIAKVLQTIDLKDQILKKEFTSQ